jgi:hypothetical protein
MQTNRAYNNAPASKSEKILGLHPLSEAVAELLDLAPLIAFLMAIFTVRA